MLQYIMSIAIVILEWKICNFVEYQISRCWSCCICIFCKMRIVKKILNKLLNYTLLKHYNPSCVPVSNVYYWLEQRECIVTFSTVTYIFYVQVNNAFNFLFFFVLSLLYYCHKACWANITVGNHLHEYQLLLHPYLVFTKTNDKC